MRLIIIIWIALVSLFFGYITGNIIVYFLPGMVVACVKMMEGAFEEMRLNANKRKNMK